MRTHTVADLIGPLALGTSAVSVIALALAFADADLSYFDPRPAVRRALETDRLRPMWQATVDGGHDLNRALATCQRLARELRADVALTLAALLILTIPTTGEIR